MGNGKERESQLNRSQQSTSGLPQCSECGQIPFSGYTESLRGDIRCGSHPNAGYCFFCLKITDSISPQWVRISPVMLRCPECSTSAVDSLPPAKKQLTKIRTDLAAMGFGLRSRVQVKVVEYSTLISTFGGHSDSLFGLTVIPKHSLFRPRNALEVLVLRGLPALWFARTLVHENMHAWLAENSINFGDIPTEEGVCEMLSYEWLRRQRGTYPAAVAAAMLQSPDPTYGESLRRIHSMCRTGVVPLQLQNTALAQLAALSRQ
jgi:hypothetical protein